MNLIKNLNKPIVLVGIMGAGKTTVGYRLSKALDLPFYDIDQEVEKIACCSVADIFFYAGEEYFRKVELKTIMSLIERKTPMVIATGGGAFINETIRKAIKQYCISIWLKANIDILVERVARKTTSRPLIDGKDTLLVMEGLVSKRYPIYSQADISVDSEVQSHGHMVQSILKSIEEYIS
ncbi:shikimate kinase [Rickettsiales endosymbiont of Stachyamoeba lipophora]|uniref:shikimate kinase n=1 Tax=Rickettsiales endosymbiont of Stachyamoeba lipophora TaxID=2486578 RepID=UPI000F64EE65|nr:shikimate kinase [Rickettsiales endosymbiont of Stachyamoeba lipophora]AZL15620.1 shikimate kinase [Rickettsiales endosymbiont of Stachyamoeba lipophora]